MQSTKNVTMKTPFEWAKIIGDKYGNKVAISFISQLDPELADNPAFAPACYFDLRNAKEGLSFWTEVNDYAQGVVGNTDEAIEQEIVAPHLEQIKNLVRAEEYRKDNEPLFDCEKERATSDEPMLDWDEEVTMKVKSPTDELIDKLIATSAGTATLKLFKTIT